MLDMPRFWIARLNLKWNCGCNDRNFMSDLHEDTDGDDCSTKKMMFSHLSRFGSKSFAEEQLVLIEQHLYKLCDKACGSPMCISQIQMCQNSIEEVREKIFFSVFDHFYLTPLWSIAEKYLLLAFVLSHNLGHT